MKCGAGTKERRRGERPNLVRLVPWAQALVAEVLRPGDLAVDLTAGTGRDTLRLFQSVGPRGCVVAFDIQETALLGTADLLRGEGARIEIHRPDLPLALSPGVHLVADSHARLGFYLPDLVPRGVLANLGYLPGGDPGVTTGTSSTLPALEQACRKLAPGGRIAITVYTGHDSGPREAAAVDDFFAALPPREWDVLRLEVPNRERSPFLLVAEKR